jgi:hypothetical protein
VSTSPLGPFVYLGSRRPNTGCYPQDMPPTLRSDFSAFQSSEQRKSWGSTHEKWATWARDFSNGQMARDITLFVDDNDLAYLVYASEENAVLHISQLSDDYQSESGRYVRAIEGSREAPALFKHKGVYFMVNSGCTGWTPNPVHFFTAATIFGPWTDLGPGAMGTSEEESVTFHSQPSFVLTVPPEGSAPLYLGDRWIAGDLEQSTYVWLPIDMGGTTPKLKWRSEWKLPSKPSTAATGGGR